MSEWAKAKDEVGSDHLAQAHMTAPNADVVVMLFHRAFLGQQRGEGWKARPQCALNYLQPCTIAPPRRIPYPSRIWQLGQRGQRPSYDKPLPYL
jgi:hypothetical protein